MAEGKERGQVHFHLCAKIYDIQCQAGRYFVHEHPKSACSWKESSINDIAEDDEVFKADTCMCAFGMTSEDATGVAPVRKPTTFMTNSLEMKKLLEAMPRMSKTCAVVVGQGSSSTSHRARALSSKPRRMPRAS